MSNSKQQRPCEHENYPISPEIIYYEDNLQYQVVSVQSPFDASVELHKIITLNKKTAVSGIHLFGFQLKCIDRNRKGRPHELKPNEESNHVVLKALNFTVENKEYHVSFGKDDDVKKKQKLHSMTYVQDVENIPCDAYHHLATIESILPREYTISQTRQEINTCHYLSEEPDIIDPTIIEQVVNVTGKGAYRSIKKILKYIVPSYVNKGKLDPEIPVIHLQISGDGRNVGRKVKHVMITVTLLDDSMNLFKSDYHYTIVLFPRTENYSTLKVATTALIQELQELKIKNKELFNDITRNIIIKEMENLKIWFEFWKIHGTDNWNYTSLMGNDKLCVLQNFNLTKLFDPECAALIKSLWDRFAKLYDLLEEKKQIYNTFI
ncbi:hypothetical protein RclHR1_30890002 [Rhizophagus clarus]|uniref:Uncharacterized protein n=1 Tax=Rhizophagus clarus TaxID=94130 RepID=A0A2Z6R9X9_9GLOM|nr:hypothetical protein RclHR1_30890002 [Rhizophagus clarus]